MSADKSSAPSTAPAPVKEAIASPPKRNWRAWALQGYVFAAVIGFTVLLVLVVITPVWAVDVAVTRALQSINAPGFFGLMGWASYIGFAPRVFFFVAAVLLLVFVLGLRWEAVTGLVAALGGSTLAEIIKFVVHRPRPTADLVRVAQELKSFSFPSGHVVFYIVFFGYLFFLTFTLLRRSVLRVVLLCAFGAMIVLVGPSRIYLGEHWFTDVVGGYLLGSVWLLVTIRVYRWGKPRFFTHQPAAPATREPAAH